MAESAQICRNIVVGVGKGTNTVAYSTDGENWTGLGTSVFTVQGNGVAAGKRRIEFVAVGESEADKGCVAYSTDGKTWKLFTKFGVKGGIGKCNSVAYLEKMDNFVAVGVGNKGAKTPTIVYSTRNSDGIVDGWRGYDPQVLFGWTYVTAITASDEVYLMVGGSEGGNVGRLASSVLVSNTGGSWGSISDTTLKITNDVAYGAGKFVAVGEPCDEKTCPRVCKKGQVATSSPEPCKSQTGVMWYNGQGPYGKAPGRYPIGYGKDYWQTIKGVNSGIGYGITYGIDKFVMVGKWGQNTIYYSYDGIEWIESSNQNIFSIGRGVTWVGNKFVAFGDKTNGSQ